MANLRLTLKPTTRYKSSASPVEVGVESLEEASALAQCYVADNNLGPEAFGWGIVEQGGVRVAQIAYSGSAWEPPSKKKLYPLKNIQLNPDLVEFCKTNSTYKLN